MIGKLFNGDKYLKRLTFNSKKYKSTSDSQYTFEENTFQSKNLEHNGHKNAPAELINTEFNPLVHSVPMPYFYS